MTADAPYLVDTGVFILYFRKNRKAIAFFREPWAELYYSRVTRKELLRPPLNAREEEEIETLLRKYRIVNPDTAIAEGFSALLAKYGYLKDHLYAEHTKNWLIRWPAHTVGQPPSHNQTSSES